ncbi:MAG: exosortase E/protease, VPEID-CTERM system [Vicinamibacterales bacterium]
MAAPIALAERRRLVPDAGREVAATPIARFLPVAAALVLLSAELLYLTFRFDTQVLYASPSIYAQLLGWAPQFLRLASSIAVVVLLLAGGDLLRSVKRLPPPATVAWRLGPLVAHASLLVAFAGITARLLEGDPASLRHPALSLTLAWLLTGAATLVAWALVVLPARTWMQAASTAGWRLAWGALGGVAVWCVGFLSEELWLSLARYTFAVVEWLLRLIYPTTVSDASRLLIGTPQFKVTIAPACSGYEGIGLVLAFLSIYLWLFRKELRFPAALILLPLGAITIWVVNAIRIVALVVIGTSGWKAIASGGFHSQAGWLAFNAVSLAFVGLTLRGGYFQKAQPAAAGDPEPDTALATTAYLGPFAAITATAMLTSAVSAGFDWLYPLRVLAGGAVIWTFRRGYGGLRWSWSWPACAMGVATFVIWLALLPSSASTKALWPAALSSVPGYWAALWLGVRAFGYVIAVPIVEELAFRGFLTRRLVAANFDALPLGRFSWPAFLLSSLLFGALHGRLWLAGTVAGMAFALALYRRGELGDAVQAHATTNGLLMVYAIATGRWAVWS